MHFSCLRETMMDTSSGVRVMEIYEQVGEEKSHGGMGVVEGYWRV